MQNVKRIFAMFLVFLVVLTIFPAAALVPTNEAAESAEGSNETGQDESEMSADRELQSTEPVSATEADSAPETVVTPETEAAAPISGNEAATESTEEATEESVGTQDSLSAHIEKGDASFRLNLATGTTISESSVLCVNALETEEAQLDEICLKYDIPCVLDFFSFEMDASGVKFSESTVPVEITFEDPFLMSIAPSAMMVFQYIDGAPVPIAMEATLSDAHATTRLVIEPETQYFNGKYIVITTDAPNIMLEVGTQVAYMAVNTINNKRVGLSGNGISFTTSGIMWHYISNQRDPAICLQPNKTFQTSNAAAYHVENTTLNGSSTGSVGGNVWNKLTKDQRRAIGLIILYGVKTNWVNSVGNAGLNTSYNLQYPTNPNQCLFAAQQIMAWEIITGNRSATYPYTCYNSTLINAFGGDVPTKYRWLEQQLQAHDNATSTIPSPEKSTFRLAWLSSGFQTVMQVVDIQYETPVPPTASLTIRKTSSTATGTNASKQFAFKIFSNSGLTNQVIATQYLAPGRSFSVTLDPDTTYYIAEVAENDWNCTTSGVSTKTVGGVKYFYRSITPSAGGSYSLTFNNEPVVKKTVTLQKSINAPAACIELIKNNSMYSLAGAEYSVSLNGVLQETLVTNASGTATSSRTYNIGDNLVIQETKAPAGFKLDTSSHTHTVVDGTNTISVSDVPLFDPPFVMTKVDSNTTTPQGNGSFSGAVFQWEYYDNTNWSGSPKATWYFATNAGGRVQYHPDYLASGYTSSTLYAPTQNSYQLPLGSLKITEVKNSLGYLVIPNPLYCTIVQDSNSTIGVNVNWTADSLKALIDVGSGNYNVPEPIDTALFGSVTVQKCDAQTGAAAQGAGTFGGAEFQIINNSTNSVNVGNKVVAPNEVCMTITTDAAGMASSGAGVLPIGKYTIKETKAPTGYLLNTNWLQEFSITADQKDHSFTASSSNACTDQIIHGGLKIIKQDAGKLTATTEADPLSGITFSVINENEQPVMVGGKSYSKGEVVMTLAIDWTGSEWAVATAADALPYGTYTVKENPAEAGSSMANENYLLNTAPQSVTIQQETQQVSVTFLNEARKVGSIHVEKLTTGNTRLQGVAFLLQWSTDGKTWQPVGYSETEGQQGCSTTPGIDKGILRTDENGTIEFAGLDATVLYRLTEIETVNGLNLLPEAVYEGPLNAEDPVLRFRVINDTSFELPKTGSYGFRWIPIVTALCALCGMLLIEPRKKWK